MPSPYDRHRPRRTVAWAAAVDRNSATRRDFPTPAGPMRVNRCEVRSPTARSSAFEERELFRAANHRRVEVALVPGDVRGDREEPEGGDALLLPFQPQRVHRLDLDRVPHEAERGVPDQNFAGRGSLLAAAPRRSPGHR